MDNDLDKLIEQAKEIPSAEVFKIQSLDGKKVVTSSLDNKEHDCQTYFKKEGLIVLITNY